MKIAFSRLPRGSNKIVAEPRELVDRFSNRHERSEMRREGKLVPVPQWHADGFIAGEIEGGLPNNTGGRWFAVLKSSPDELRGWLEHYATTHPADALEMIAEILPTAVAKLKQERYR